MKAARLSTAMFCIFIAVSHSVPLRFKVSVDSDCVKTVKGTSWPVESWMTCLMQCKCRFGDLCRHVVFNNLTMACTVADPVAGDGGELSPSGGDIIYSQKQDAAPVCNATAGYELHQKCGTAVCLQLVGGNLHYNGAADQCTIRKGIMYTVTTSGRYALFRSFLATKQVLSTHVWIGLRWVHKSFYWSSRAKLSQEQADYLWTGGRPNNEECGAAEAFGTSVALRFRNQNCNNKYRYVCEQTIF